MRTMKKKRMRMRNNMNIYIDIDKKDLDELKRMIQYEVDRTLSNINTNR